MIDDTPTTANDDPKAASRAPLNKRSKVQVNQTVLRVVGSDSKTPALDVAAFQSFAD